MSSQVGPRSGPHPRRPAGFKAQTWCRVAGEIQCPLTVRRADIKPTATNRGIENSKLCQTGLAGAKMPGTSAFTARRAGALIQSRRQASQSSLSAAGSTSHFLLSTSHCCPVFCPGRDVDGSCGTVPLPFSIGPWAMRSRLESTSNCFYSMSMSMSMSSSSLSAAAAATAASFSSCPPALASDSVTLLSVPCRPESTTWCLPYLGEYFVLCGHLSSLWMKSRRGGSISTHPGLSTCTFFSPKVFRVSVTTSRRPAHFGAAGLDLLSPSFTLP